MGSDGFDYFVIRVSRSAAHPEQVVGLVERLGSGEKRVFETAEHLAALVTGWTVGRGVGDAPVTDEAKAGTDKE
jgi:hypothetical protein